MTRPIAWLAAASARTTVAIRSKGSSDSLPDMSTTTTPVLAPVGRGGAPPPPGQRGEESGAAAPGRARQEKRPAEGRCEPEDEHDADERRTARRRPEAGQVAERRG